MSPEWDEHAVPNPLFSSDWPPASTPDGSEIHFSVAIGRGDGLARMVLKPRYLLLLSVYTVLHVVYI